MYTCIVTYEKYGFRNSKKSEFMFENGFVWFIKRVCGESHPGTRDEERKRNVNN